MIITPKQMCVFSRGETVTPSSTFFQWYRSFCTRPNRSRVGAIDKPDRLEQAFDQYDISEDPEKIFTNDFLIEGHEKMIIFGVFDDFISNFTYYDLY